MVKNIISLYLFASVIFLSIMFVYSFSRGRSLFARAFGLLALTLNIYLFGYLLELNVASLEARLFWNQVQYFGIPFFSGFWLLVSLLYTGHFKKTQWYKIVAIFVIPIITFILRLTNEFHLWFYSSIEMNTLGDLTFLVLGKGPWYYVQAGYSFIVLVLCTFFYYQKLVQSNEQEKKQFQLLFWASIVPYIALLFIVIDPGRLGIDYSAIVLPPCILLINYALSRYNFLELKILARERVFEESSKGLILMDRYYVIRDFNSSSVRYLSWFNIELVNEDLKTVLSNHQELLNSIYNRERNIQVVQEDNLNHYIAFTAEDIGLKDDLSGVLLSIEDVTVREELTLKLKEMAQIDMLTGINNRRHFVEESQKAIERAKRYNEPLSLLMIDIDYFKRINDNYGHACGDKVIQEVALLIKSNFRSTDVIGRLGGEEFAITMLKSNKDEAYVKAEELRVKVEQMHFDFDSSNLHISISIGITELINLSELSLDDLINQADKAMYQAKKLGRNTIIIYNVD
jgi:diguanylate cyclase (GGDEF)-like protein